MNFGLSDDILSDLAAVSRRYPYIEKVVIFGSRARGTAKPSSDVDLAVIAPGMDDQEFTRLWNDLDGLPLVFQLDVLHFDRLANPSLKEKILRDGKILYP